jgi:chromate transporter
LENTKPVGFREAFWFWVKLGFINFGGPAGQIAIMHEELVERKRWVSEGQFLRTLNFCMLLPGPEAQQVATYIGWRMHGTLGGIVAGSFFVIPSVFVLLLLSYLAVAYSEVPAITGLLYGIQPVVIAIVVEAVLRIGRRTLHHAALVSFAVASFVAIYLLSVPFPLVVLGAALTGLLLQRWWPEIFRPSGHGGGDSTEDAETTDESAGGDVVPCFATCGSSGSSSFCGRCRWARYFSGVGGRTCSYGRRSSLRGRRSLPSGVPTRS